MKLTIDWGNKIDYKNLVKKVVVGCSAALIIGFANVETYAHPAEVLLRHHRNDKSSESVLYESKERWIENYSDHSDEIANMGFKVIYTGVV